MDVFKNFVYNLINNIKISQTKEVWNNITQSTIRVTEIENRGQGYVKKCLHSLKLGSNFWLLDVFNVIRRYLCFKFLFALSTHCRWVINYCIYKFHDLYIKKIESHAYFIWNLIWKSPGFVQFGVQFDPLWSQIYHPWTQRSWFETWALFCRLV